MKRLIFVIIFFLAYAFSVTLEIAHAAESCGNFSFSSSQNPLDFSTNGLRLDPNITYTFNITSHGGYTPFGFKPDTNGVLTVHIDKDSQALTVTGGSEVSGTQGQKQAFINLLSAPNNIRYLITNGLTPVCEGAITVTGDAASCEISITNHDPDNPFGIAGRRTVEFEGILPFLKNSDRVFVRIVSPENREVTNCDPETDDDGNFDGSINLTEGTDGYWSLDVFQQYSGDLTACNKNGDAPICSLSFPVGVEGEIIEGHIGGGTILRVKDICEYAGAKRAECATCVSGDPLKPGIWTALGCIGANPQDFVIALLKVGTGIAGGIALVMMIYAGFLMMTSAGNPEKLNHAREIFLSAISGLLLIIFSVIILKIIGIDILAIPGLT